MMAYRIEQQPRSENWMTICDGPPRVEVVMGRRDDCQAVLDEMSLRLASERAAEPDVSEGTAAIRYMGNDKAFESGTVRRPRVQPVPEPKGSVARAVIVGIALAAAAGGAYYATQDAPPAQSPGADQSSP